MAGAAPSFCHTRGALLRSDKHACASLSLKSTRSAATSRETPPAFSTALRDAAERGADLVVTPEMALPGYCIGDLVEDAEFLAANERAMREIAAAARDITAVVGFVDVDPTAPQRQRHDPEVQRRGGRPRRPDPAASAQVTAAELSLLRRQTVLHAGRSARTGRCARRRDRSRLGVSICEDMWDEFYDVKPLAELSRQGRRASC